MPNFITDNSSLAAAKNDLRPVPSGHDATKYVAASDWNEFRSALVDIQAFCRGAPWLGMAENATDPAPSGVADYLWLKDDNTLWMTSDGVQTKVGPSSGGGFGPTAQLFSSTGIQTVALDASTTILRFTAAAQVDLVGLSGGSADRVVLLENKGAGNVILYAENGNATPANRLTVDGILVNSGGKAIAVYDAVAQRWTAQWLLGANTPGGLTVNGTLGVTASLAVAGNVGFYGTGVQAKPTVTGSRGGNAALASLLTALATLGLITDSSS